MLMRPSGDDGGRRRRRSRAKQWRRRTARAFVIGLAALLAALVGVGISATSGGPARSSGSDVHEPARVRVTVDMSAGGKRVPSSFLGISTEYGGLALFERKPSVFERVLGLLQVPGGGPVSVRVGGDSADRTFAASTGQRLASGAGGLTPAWFARTGEVVRRTGVRVIIDLNLATASSGDIVSLARDAERALPRGSIAGFEVGNEPDLYHRQPALADLARSGDVAAAAARRITPKRYARAFAADARLLARVAPGVTLVGPAVAYPRLDASWLAVLLAGPHPRLGLVSAHLYPYSECASPGSSQYPTITRLLSRQATAGLPRLVSHAVRIADRAGVPLRLTELNSVSCGGRPGVSDAFVTGLWAPDALFELLHAGIAGVNVHVRDDAVNGAFAITSRGVVARPLLYGLILFARTLGADARVLPLRVTLPRGINASVWAVRVAGDLLHVLVIDKSPHAAVVSLDPPARGPASVQRLVAPGPSARSGVSLDGQQLGPDGDWHGHRSHETVARRHDGYTVTVGRFSAALLTFHLNH